MMSLPVFGWRVRSCSFEQFSHSRRFPSLWKPWVDRLFTYVLSLFVFLCLCFSQRLFFVGVFFDACRHFVFCGFVRSRRREEPRLRQTTNCVFGKENFVWCHRAEKERTCSRREELIILSRLCVAVSEEDHRASSFALQHAPVAPPPAGALGRGSFGKPWKMTMLVTPQNGSSFKPSTTGSFLSSSSTCCFPVPVALQDDDDDDDSTMPCMCLSSSSSSSSTHEVLEPILLTSMLKKWNT